MRLPLLFIATFCILLNFPFTSSEDWKKKDVRDYSDADLERLYEQWEEDDEPLPVDELPEWDPRKPQPQVDINDPELMKDPEALHHWRNETDARTQAVLLWVELARGGTQTARTRPGK